MLLDLCPLDTLPLAEEAALDEAELLPEYVQCAIRDGLLQAAHGS